MILLHCLREMENVNGHLKFQNHYGRVYVQLSGNCKMWRSDAISEDGGWLSADVFVDILEQKWHANLKIAKLFASVEYTFNMICLFKILPFTKCYLGIAYVC